MFDDLMRAVLESPNDDAPRLVLADWLDEHGDPQRSDFIRVQIELANLSEPPQQTLSADWIGPWKYCSECLKIEGEGKCRYHELEDQTAKLWPNIYDWFPGIREMIPMGEDTRWYITRGFPSAVSLTLRQFMGGEECDNCGGVGGAYLAAGDRPEQIAKLTCDKCYGTGHIPGLVESLGSRWPITEIKLTCRNPYRGEYDDHDKRRDPAPFTWFSGFAVGHADEIPAELYDRLEKQPDGKRYWLTNSSAKYALSNACVDLMRSRCDPPLPAMRWADMPISQ